MRIAPLLMVALLGGASITTTAVHACGPLTVKPATVGTGTTLWTWGTPDQPATHQDFTGPGVYTQTISVSGVSGTYSQLGFMAVVIGDFSSAWSMLYAPPFLDCQGRPGLTATPVVAGTEVIPGATLNVTSQMPVCWPPTLMLQIDVAFVSPFAFDPSKRYGIATLSFDHSASVADSGDATHCGGAELGMCFRVYGPIGDADLPTLSWQNGACNGSTPARPSTWGAIKQRYR